MSGRAMSFEAILVKVKEHPELWLTSHKYYKQKAFQTQTWQQIASALNVEVKLVKSRWKHLKDHYRKEVRKIKAKEMERSRWQYFDQLAGFLPEELHTFRELHDNDSDPEPPKKVPKISEPSSSSSQDPNLFMISKLNEINDKMDNQIGNNEDLKNDPDYMFLMSVLPTIRNLSAVQKFVFRGKINEWLLEALTQNEYPDQYETKYILDD